jgi:hypothetical protein
LEGTKSPYPLRGYARPATREGQLGEILGFFVAGLALLAAALSMNLSARLEICRGPLVLLAALSFVFVVIQLVRFFAERRGP